MPKKPRRQRRELRVVFDTNTLYSDSASHLVRHEVSNLILQSRFPDLTIAWYLPAVVRHERQFQMQKRAMALLPAVAKVETLLGHNLNITREVLLASVEQAVARWHQDLALVPLELDATKVEWDRILTDACYRKPPFEDGEKEKGFRDALLVESFFQLAVDSPRTTQVCRLVLLTADQQVSAAVTARVSQFVNVSVIGSLEELKGLINTLASEVDESYIEALTQKASAFYFVPKDESTLFYKEKIQEKLKAKFKSELSSLPPGASMRENDTWTVFPPSFSKKVAQRVFWACKLEIETRCLRAVEESWQTTLSPLSTDPYSNPYSNLLKVGPPAHSALPIQNPLSSVTWGLGAESYYASLPSASINIANPLSINIANPLLSTPTYRNVQTHAGRDIYEVRWSADVTTARNLRRPSIDDIVHVETVWKQV
jgi:hypothetical protein